MGFLEFQLKGLDEEEAHLAGDPVATYFHVFWVCPVISKYWEEMKVTVERTMGRVIPCGFEALYLGLRRDSAKGSEHKYTYNILLQTTWQLRDKTLG